MFIYADIHSLFIFWYHLAFLICTCLQIVSWKLEVGNSRWKSLVEAKQNRYSKENKKVAWITNKRLELGSSSLEVGSRKLRLAISWKLAVETGKLEVETGNLVGSCVWEVEFGKLEVEPLPTSQYQTPIFFLSTSNFQ